MSDMSCTLRYSTVDDGVGVVFCVLLGRSWNEW